MTTRHPQRHVGRWVLGVFSIVLVALAVCEWLQWPFARGPLQLALQQGLQREVVLGADFGLRLFGKVRLRSDSLRIGGPANGPHPPEREDAPRFLSAGEFALVLPYSTVFAFLRGERGAALQVASLDVSRLALALVREADGRANWQFGEKKPQPEAPTPLPGFDRLVVQDARLWLDDAQTQLSLFADVQTREGVALADSAQNGLEARASGSFRDLPLRASLRTSGVLPIFAGENTAAVPLWLSIVVADNELTLDGKVRDLLALSALDAEFRLAGASLGAVGDAVGIALPTTAPFRTHGRITRNGAVWESSVAAFSIGSSRLEGEFRYDPSAEPPLFAGKLRGARLALDDLGPAVTSIGPLERSRRAATERRQQGRVLPQQEFNLPALEAMQAEVQVDLDRFDLGTPQLAPLAPLRARVVLKDSVLAIDNLRAHSAGGELRGRLSLDARPKLPLWQSDLSWSGIQLQKLLTARNPRAATKEGEAAQGYLSGLLGGTARLRGSGRSTGAMLGSLDGAVQLWVRDGAISELLVEMMGIDLAEGLGIVFSGGDNKTPMRCAVTRWLVEDGVARPEVAVIDTPDSTLLLSGQIGLAKERLDLTVQVKPKDMSLFSLRGPLHVRGSFKDPQVDFAPRAIGWRLAGAAALAVFATPLAGLLAFIDLGEGETALCQDALQNLQAAPRAPRRSR